LRNAGHGVFPNNVFMWQFTIRVCPITIGCFELSALSFELPYALRPAPPAIPAPTMIHAADKAFHFVFPGTFTDLTIAKQRLTYS